MRTIAPPEPSQAEINAAASGQFALGLVAFTFGVLPAEIMSPSRRAPVAFARQAAMYLSHVVFRSKFGQVGRAFGRDHTTASHACHVVEDALDDPEIEVLIEACAESLRNLPEIEPPDRPLGLERLFPLLLPRS